MNYKADEFAKLSRACTFSVTVQPGEVKDAAFVTSGGGLHVANGYFTASQARELGKWIKDTFGELPHGEAAWDEGMR